MSFVKGDPEREGTLVPADAEMIGGREKPHGRVAVVSPQRKDGFGNLRDPSTLRSTGDTTAESPGNLSLLAPATLTVRADQPCFAWQKHSHLAAPNRARFVVDSLLRDVLLPRRELR